MVLHWYVGRYGWKETQTYLQTKFTEMTTTFKKSVQIGKEEPLVRMEGLGGMREHLFDTCTHRSIVDLTLLQIEDIH